LGKVFSFTNSCTLVLTGNWGKLCFLNIIFHNDNDGYNKKLATLLTLRPTFGHVSIPPKNEIEMKSEARIQQRRWCRGNQKVTTPFDSIFTAPGIVEQRKIYAHAHFSTKLVR
jgi:hypothetical protein